MGLAQKIEARVPRHRQPRQAEAGNGRLPAQLLEAMVKDVGAVAIGDDRWEIYVGGAAGSQIRKGGRVVHGHR